MYRSFIKRLLDFIISSIGFIVLSPVFFVVGLLLLICNRGNPFFFQSRPGKKGEIFKIIKFKTMNNKTDANGVLLDDARRLTKLGRFVREKSLDEIPQLINVIKGDMSLIGPRPLLPQYLELYSSEQKTRHNVKPGITGWAQVNGRNAISWTEKFNFDIYYVNHYSFKLDIRILYLTFVKVLKSEGVNSSEVTTMEAFTGEN